MLQAEDHACTLKTVDCDGEEEWEAGQGELLPVLRTRQMQVVKVKPEDDCKGKEVRDLGDETEDGQVTQVWDQGQEEQGWQEDHQPLVLGQTMDEGCQILGDEDQVGAAEANLGHQQSGVNGQSAGCSEGGESHIAVGDCPSNAR